MKARPVRIQSELRTTGMFDHPQLGNNAGQNNMDQIQEIDEDDYENDNDDLFGNIDMDADSNQSFDPDALDHEP